MAAPWGYCNDDGENARCKRASLLRFCRLFSSHDDDGMADRPKFSQRKWWSELLWELRNAPSTPRRRSRSLVALRAMPDEKKNRSIFRLRRLVTRSQVVLAVDLRAVFAMRTPPGLPYATGAPSDDDYPASIRSPDCAVSCRAKTAIWVVDSKKKTCCLISAGFQQGTWPITFSIFIKKI